MSHLDRDGLHHLLTWVQDGVVSRRQILELGGTDNDIERMVRRRDLTTVHQGVYVHHTGRLSQRQKEWAAVLAFWPAALTLESALPMPPLAVVRVAVDLERRPRSLDRVWVQRTPDFASRVNWRGAPPHVDLEHATIEVMSRRIANDDVAGAFAVLTSVCHTRRTDPTRIAATLAARARIPGRKVIGPMLADLRDGACSVLERGYLIEVERAHGLPRAVRQRTSRSSGKRTDQDVRYDEFGVVIELDGRAFHDGSAARDADARRDLAELAVGGAVTARVTYGLVFRDGCWTAAMVGGLLRRRGWTGTFGRCPRCPVTLVVP